MVAWNTNICDSEHRRAVPRSLRHKESRLYFILAGWRHQRVAKRPQPPTVQPTPVHTPAAVLPHKSPRSLRSHPPTHRATLHVTPTNPRVTPTNTPSARSSAHCCCNRVECTRTSRKHRRRCTCIHSAGRHAAAAADDDVLSPRRIFQLPVPCAFHPASQLPADTQHSHAHTWYWRSCKWGCYCTWC